MNKDTKESKKVENQNQPTSNRITTIVAVFAVVISGIAAYYSYRQSDIAQDTTIRQLRAYIYTEQDGWQGLNGKNFFANHYRFVNYGQTPAQVIEVAGQVEILPYPLPRDYSPEYQHYNEINQIFLIFPHIQDSTAVGGNIPTKNKYVFSGKEIISITSDSSKVRAYEFMRITYLDIFGVLRHTYSCKFLNPRSISYNPNGSIKTFQMAAYEFFNSFD